jgi:hypothetical protein
MVALAVDLSMTGRRKTIRKRAFGVGALKRFPRWKKIEGEAE